MCLMLVCARGELCRAWGILIRKHLRHAFFDAWPQRRALRTRACATVVTRKTCAQGCGVALGEPEFAYVCTCMGRGKVAVSRPRNTCTRHCGDAHNMVAPCDRRRKVAVPRARNTCARHCAVAPHLPAGLQCRVWGTTLLARVPLHPALQGCSVAPEAYMHAPWRWRHSMMASYIRRRKVAVPRPRITYARHCGAAPNMRAGLQCRARRQPA